MTTPPSPADGSLPPPLDELLPLSEAAAQCGLSASHLRLLVRRGEVWGIKVGRDWLTTEAAIRAYQAQGHKPGPRPRHAP